MLIWEVDIGFASADSPSVSATGRGIPSGAADSQLLAIQANGATGSIEWANAALVNTGILVQVQDDIVYAAVRTPGTSLGVDFLDVEASTGIPTHRGTMTSSPIFTVGTSVAADGTIVVAGINGVVSASAAPPGC